MGPGPAVVGYYIEGSLYCTGCVDIDNALDHCINGDTADMDTMPITRLARFRSMTLNSSTNSILFSCQTLVNTSLASLEQLILGLSDGLSLGL